MGPLGDGLLPVAAICFALAYFFINTLAGHDGAAAEAPRAAARGAS